MFDKYVKIEGDQLEESFAKNFKYKVERLVANAAVDVNVSD